MIFSNDYQNANAFLYFIKETKSGSSVLTIDRVFIILSPGVLIFFSFGVSLCES